MIFFNFRPDRARQITRTFTDPAFDGFERKNGFFPLNFVCMTQYDETMPNVSVAFPPEELKNIFQRFYRMDRARERDGSFGLGLSIAETIIAKHRGRIWAESQNGVNSFLVELGKCGRKTN